MDGIEFYSLLAFAGGLISVLIAVPLFRRLARRLDFMDRPAANHKGHAKATPLLGGAAMFTGWCCCIGAGLLIALRFPPPELTVHIEGLRRISGQLGCLVLGALLTVVLGLIDDKYPLSAKVKFGGQFLIAVLAVSWGGVRLNLFLELPALTWGISVFWLMLLMNSINFFDNMDGLAVGTIAIAMFFFTVIAGLNGQLFSGVLAALTCGAACGFWCYNRAPASIFMGDSGSHFLGYMAAVLAAKVTFFTHGVTQSKLSVLIPLFILALPLFDTGMVVLIRTLHRKPFWIGDHNHISHRFVKMGLTRTQAVNLVHLLSLCIGLGMLPVYWGEAATAMVLVLQSILFLLVITILQFFLGGGADKTLSDCRNQVKESKNE